MRDYEISIGTIAFLTRLFHTTLILDRIQLILCFKLVSKLDVRSLGGYCLILIYHSLQIWIGIIYNKLQWYCNGSEHTEQVSRSAPQMSYAVPIYYDLHDIMNDAANQEGEFVNLNKDIATAVSLSLQRYQKYYDFMDSLDVYYIALILDPRYKTRLLEQELRDNANLII